MKTIDELAQVLLTVDSRLDLVLLGDNNTGLVVDDDAHRELFDAVNSAAELDDNVSEVALEYGGHFTMPGEKYQLAYLYLADGVVWFYEGAE